MVNAAATESALHRWLWPAALLCAGVLAYSNCFRGEFIFDDNGAVLNNPHIQKLWPLTESMWAPPRTTTVGRPVACLSFALTYAFAGYEMWGYRAVNLVIHLCCALALFGIVRRTLLIQNEPRRPSGVAFAVALLWLLHPLQTNLVNYIAQRTESLMALFYLLTLYCAIRAWQSELKVWQVLSIFCCAAGMATKEVMVSAPLVVLLYDRTFVSVSFTAALKRSRALYAGLFATWLLMAALLATGATAAGSAIGRERVSPVEYALTQAGVIFYYLRLALWPDPLVFDYAWPVAENFAAAALPLVGIVLLLSLTCWAILKRKPYGFLGAFFFLALAPSSSILPLPDMLVEYRMYLPLAAVCALFGVALFRVRPTGATPLMESGAIAVAALLFATLTFARNEHYRTAELIWRDAAIKRPQNARAHSNLAVALMDKGRLDEAQYHLEVAYKLNPQTDSIDQNLGSVLAMQSRFREALPHLLAAAEKNPADANAHFNAGNVLSELGQRDNAIAAYRAALKINPRLPNVHYNLAVELNAAGRADEALAHLHQALAHEPKHANALVLSAVICAKAGRSDAARAHLAAALKLEPQNPYAQRELAKLNGQK